MAGVGLEEGPDDVGAAVRMALASGRRTTPKGEQIPASRRARN
jgi:hypothetical protein